MNESDGFPRQLLEQEPAARIAYFEAKLVGHQRLREALDNVMRRAAHPSKGQLIFIFGPSGGGKTTLRVRLFEKLLLSEVAAMEADRSYMPTGFAEIPAWVSATRSWRGPFTTMLRGMDEPMIGSKVAYKKSDLGRPGQVLVDRNTTVDGLQDALENCFRYRRTRTFLLDEAHHVFRGVGGADRMLAQMDILKSLANRTGVTLVLFGTYELMPILDLSDQVIRRAYKLHLARYRINAAADAQQFLGVLSAFQAALPIPSEPDLLSDYEYMYERSLGVVGVLKEWLDRALIEAVYAEQSADAGVRAATFAEHLRSTSLTDTELLTMLERIEEGEQTMWERSNRRGELRARLQAAGSQAHAGQPMPLIVEEPVPQIGQGSANSTATSPPPRRRGRPPKERVGTRAPARDKVGHDSPINRGAGGYNGAQA